MPYSVSDLKLYEIQASRACNFIKFQVQLESSRPHKSLCQQNSCQRYLKIHILNNVDNLVITACFMNLIIFRIWLSLLTLLLITLAYADTYFCSKDFYNIKYFFHHCFPQVNAHRCNLVLFQPQVPHTLTLEILFFFSIFLCPY